MDKKFDRTEKRKDDAGRMERMRTADSALRMALNLEREGNGVRYPHNFAFRAMQKVHEKEMAKKRESRIVEIAVVSLSSIAGLVALAFLIDWNELMRVALPKRGFNADALIPEMPNFNLGMVGTIAFCFVFFVCLNNLLKKIFKEER